VECGGGGGYTGRFARVPKSILVVKKLWKRHLMYYEKEKGGKGGGRGKT